MRIFFFRLSHFEVFSELYSGWKIKKILVRASPPLPGIHQWLLIFLPFLVAEENGLWIWEGQPHRKLVPRDVHDLQDRYSSAWRHSAGLLCGQRRTGRGTHVAEPRKCVGGHGLLAFIGGKCLGCKCVGGQGLLAVIGGKCLQTENIVSSKRKLAVSSGGFRIYSWGSYHLRWGCQPMILANFAQKLHENAKHIAVRGARVPSDSPLGSANSKSSPCGTNESINSIQSWSATWPRIWLQLTSFARLRCETPHRLQCIWTLYTIYWFVDRKVRGPFQ